MDIISVLKNHINLGESMNIQAKTIEMLSNSPDFIAQTIDISQVDEIGTKGGSNNMILKKFINKYEDQLNQIISDSDKFYLVNAGRMNHGKSSLLNSLTGEVEDIFEVQDKRTTVKNKMYQYNDNTYFIDTPGLNANDSDDQEAIKAYKKANLILFVHNLSVGDIRKEEVRDIKTIISCFNSIDNLANKFVLVLTGKDAIQSKDDLNNIKSKVLLDIKNETGLSGFKVFTVSNTTYKNGLKNNKNKLIEHSGIKLLHEYIDSFIMSSNSEIQDRICERIDLETEKVKDKLQRLKEEQSKKLKKDEKAINEFRIRINNILSSRFYIIERANDRLNRCMDEISSLKG
ncbi:GTPase [Gemella sanguinis]|uniref:GTPase n=1 Tax=Gemella sanguinis TaxID=84135 RepID=UPI0026E93AA6|nr:GTPase [Gemella sanguinis]